MTAISPPADCLYNQQYCESAKEWRGVPNGTSFNSSTKWIYEGRYLTRGEWLSS